MIVVVQSRKYIQTETNNEKQMVYTHKLNSTENNMTGVLQIGGATTANVTVTNNKRAQRFENRSRRD